MTKSNLDNLRAEVIGTALNEKLLESVPHKRIEDLAVICRYFTGEGASFIVTNEAASQIGLEGKEAVQLAIRNSVRDGYRICTMTEMLNQISGTQMPAGGVDERILVITNGMNYRGAAGPFISREVREELRERMGGDFYILPSSIHECLAVRVSDGAAPEELKEMVMTVNRTQVAPDDRLSNEVYYVDESLKIRLAGQRESESKRAVKTNTEMLAASGKEAKAMHLHM